MVEAKPKPTFNNVKFPASFGVNPSIPPNKNAAVIQALPNRSPRPSIKNPAGLIEYIIPGVFICRLYKSG